MAICSGAPSTTKNADVGKATVPLPALAHYRPHLATKIANAITILRKSILYCTNNAVAMVGAVQIEPPACGTVAALVTVSDRAFPSERRAMFYWGP
jgi:hypothetical protein